MGYYSNSNPQFGKKLSITAEIASKIEDYLPGLGEKVFKTLSYAAKAYKKHPKYLKLFYYKMFDGSKNVYVRE